MKKNNYFRFLHSVLGALLTFAALTTGQTAWAEDKTVTYTISYTGMNTLTATPDAAGFDNSSAAITGPAISGSNDNFHLYLHDNIEIGVNLPSSSGDRRMVVSNDGLTFNFAANITTYCESYYVKYIAVKDHNGTAISVFNPNLPPQEQTNFPFDLNVDIDKMNASGATVQEFPVRTANSSTTIKTIAITYGTSPRTYNISYTNAVGGQKGVTNNNRTTYSVATPTFNITAPTRTGYTLGTVTYTDAAHTSATTASLPMTISRGDAATRKAITFNASWTANTYTLRLHHNDGGEDDYTDMAMTYDEAANIQTITRTGYTFANWSTNPDGTGTTYTEGQSVSNLTATDGDVFHLYAQWTANTYTVAFNGNGNTGGNMSNQSFTYDKAQNLTSNAFSRAFTVTYAYNGATGGNSEATGTATATFNGWAESTGGEKVYNNSQLVSNLSTENNATVNLFAKWTGGSVILPTPTKTGYTFGGWYSDSELNTPVGAGGASYTPSANITLYAKWTANTYTITYDLAGGSVASANPTAYTIESDAITLTNPTRTGYTFAGWTGTDLSTPTMNVKISTGCYGDRSYTATWTANTYTLRLYHNDGSNDYTDMAMTYDQAANIQNVTRTGYTFANWSTNSDGSGTTYTEGQSVSNLTATNGATVNLYAKWTANTYTLRLHHNDGTNGYTDMAMTYDQAANIQSVTRTGYTFANWSTNPDGSGTTYTEGQSVSNLTATNGATVNLYAKWTANNYAVTLDNQSATTAGTTSVTVTYDASMSAITVPTRTGYTFGGYYTERNGGGTQYYNADGTSARSWDIASATTLYAQWTAHTYTLCLHHNDGTDAVTNQTLTYDQAANIQNVSRIGYHITNWTTNADGSGTSYSAGESVTNLSITQDAVIDLYAQWVFVPLECPLTLEAIANGEIEVSSPKSGMKYSINGGAKTAVTGSAITVKVGDIVQFYGNGTSITSYSGTKIQCSADCYIYGNIMSLVDETGFATNTTLTGTETFKSLFNGNKYIKNHSNNALVLPATTLAEYCYLSMFQGCENLNYVICLATNKSGSSCTSGWLNSVARSGTFVKAAGTSLDSDIPYYWTTYENPPLFDNADNSAPIKALSLSGLSYDVVLQGRTLFKDGYWNTLCLPFSMTAAQIAASPLADATVMELDNSNTLYDCGNGVSHATGLDNGILYLNFTTAYDPTTAPSGSIVAGKPYIIKWTSGSDLVNPVFTGVTVTSTTPTEEGFSGGKFVGQYSPFPITSSNRDQIILLGSENKLGYSQSDRDLRSFRAHFEVPASTPVKAYQMNFGDEETETGIISMEDGRWKMEDVNDAWYDMSGRKLEGKPTKKGIYIRNGKKVIVK